jgi:D-apionolactonase
VLDELDNGGVCYSINPQVHAFDNQSLVETLATQADTVTSTRAFAGTLPIYVSPVTLQPRFNPNATGPEPEPAPGELPSSVDPRQMSLFGAGWTLGSVKYLAQAGAAAITYYETTGWRGVMEQAGGSPLPDQFRSLPGAVFPLYHVLADIGEFAGDQVVPVTTADNLIADALALEAPDGRRRVLVANLTPHTRTIHIRGLRSTKIALKTVDEHNALAAMQEPEQFRAAPGETRNVDAGTLTLELAPFAVARLDESPA